MSEVCQYCKQVTFLPCNCRAFTVEWNGIKKHINSGTMLYAVQRFCDNLEYHHDLEDGDEIIVKAKDFQGIEKEFIVDVNVRWEFMVTEKKEDNGKAKTFFKE